MTKDTIVLSTAWLNQPALGQRPARTLLVGAATLTVRQRFGAFSFDLQADSTTVTEDAGRTLTWLTDQLTEPCRLLMWRAEDIVVPSLITAAETLPETLTGASLLRQLERTFTGEVIDVATPYGGARATSFDAIAHEHNVSFVPMTKDALADAHRTGDHGAIRRHLAARAMATWQLWLLKHRSAADLIAATDEWLDTPDAGLKP